MVNSEFHSKTSPLTIQTCSLQLSISKLKLLIYKKPVWLSYSKNSFSLKKTTWTDFGWSRQKQVRMNLLQIQKEFKDLQRILLPFPWNRFRLSSLIDSQRSHSNSTWPFTMPSFCVSLVSSCWQLLSPEAT